MPRKIRRIGKNLLLTVGIIGLFWWLLTLIAQSGRQRDTLELGDFSTAPDKALIVYNPDPFYDLDARVCHAFGKSLAKAGWAVRIETAGTAEGEDELFELYVVCANTYNWAPDRPVSGFIEEYKSLKNAPVVAITLGSGSTERSQQILEKIIRERGGRLLASETYWLMRPNDSLVTDFPNVQVAIRKAADLGRRIAAEWKVKTGQ